MQERIARSSGRRAVLSQSGRTSCPVAACAGLVVLPDTYFPGWRATVKGREAPIYPTDGAFRSVPVPKGTSRVEFRYEPRAFCTGLVLAVAGIAGFVLIVLVSAWRSRASAARRPVRALPDHVPLSTRVADPDGRR